MRVVIAGAGGYVGRALVPRLVESGHDVVALGRRARSLPTGRGITSRTVDVSDEGSTAVALAGADLAYYLVELDAGDAVRLSRRDLARTFGRAALAAGVRRIVCLARRGAGDGIGDELRAGGAEVVELRAAVILGAGSPAFEMLRALSERFPVIPGPKWARTPVHPVALRDVLKYLERAPNVDPGTYDVGLAAPTTFAEMFVTYARERGLQERRVVAVPLAATDTSATCVGVLTPLGRAASRALLEQIDSATQVRDLARATAAFDLEPTTLEEALRLALDDEAEEIVRTLESRGRGRRDGSYGVTIELPIDASMADAVDIGLSRAGGDSRWVVARREPGAVVVSGVQRLPGDIWLGTFVVEPDTSTPAWRLRAVGVFRPRGLRGLLGWLALTPLHRPIFTLLAKRRIRDARGAARPTPPARF
jgi:uncharacterized protein YbjT (DUF2867 family)